MCAYERPLLAVILAVLLAVPTLTWAQELNPDAVLAFEAAGSAFTSQDLQGAEQGFSRALELEPELAPAMKALVQVYLDMRRPAAADAMATRYLELKPDDLHMLELRVLARREVGDRLATEAAIADLSRVDRKAGAKYYRALAEDAVNAGTTQEALTYYTRAVQADPEHAGTHYALAIQLIGAGEKARAKEHLEAYLRLAPEGTEVEVARELVQAL